MQYYTIFYQWFLLWNFGVYRHMKESESHFFYWELGFSKIVFLKRGPLDPRVFNQCQSGSCSQAEGRPIIFVLVSDAGLRIQSWILTRSIGCWVVSSSFASWHFECLFSCLEGGRCKSSWLCFRALHSLYVVICEYIVTAIAIHRGSWKKLRGAYYYIFILSYISVLEK